MDKLQQLTELRILELHTYALEKLLELDEDATPELESDRYQRLLNLYQRMDSVGSKRVTESASAGVADKLNESVSDIQDALTKTRRASTANAYAAAKQAKGGGGGASGKNS